MKCGLDDEPIRIIILLLSSVSSISIVRLLPLRALNHNSQNDPVCVSEVEEQKKTTLAANQNAHIPMLCLLNCSGDSKSDLTC